MDVTGEMTAFGIVVEGGFWAEALLDEVVEVGDLEGGGEVEGRGAGGACCTGIIALSPNPNPNPNPGYALSPTHSPSLPPAPKPSAPKP